MDQIWEIKCKQDLQADVGEEVVRKMQTYIPGEVKRLSYVLRVREGRRVVKK